MIYFSVLSSFTVNLENNINKFNKHDNILNLDFNFFSYMCLLDGYTVFYEFPLLKKELIKIRLSIEILTIYISFLNKIK